MTAALCGATALAFAAQAPGQYDYGTGPSQYQQEEGQPANEVRAEGNFAGGLAFDPPELAAVVGQLVRWRNTDCCVPHTATEDHRLWDLGGSYGATPANPSGFGPGTTVERTFEAGTHHYYCRVHGKSRQSGVVAVPVSVGRQITTKRVRLKAKRRKRGRRRARRRYLIVQTVRIEAKWASAPPAAGLVFDVERRAGGDWAPLVQGTRETKGTFPGGPSGVLWQIRARLRRESDGAATDWSPPASVRS